MFIFTQWYYIKDNNINYIIPCENHPTLHKMLQSKKMSNIDKTTRPEQYLVHSFGTLMALIKIWD